MNRVYRTMAIVTAAVLVLVLVLAIRYYNDPSHATIKTEQRTTDQTRLAQIAQRARDWEAVEAAWAKLSDQSLLRMIAASHPRPYYRLLAVGKLTDQDRLKKSAAEDRDPEVRAAALAKLRDDTLVAQIAVADESPEVRFAAVARLSDSDLLVNVLVQTPWDSRTFYAAVEKLPDPAHLSRIAVAAVDASVRRSVVEKLTDSTALSVVASRSGDNEIRRAALAKLEDESGLARVAIESVDPNTSVAAVAKLHDQERLAAVVRSAAPRQARLDALARLHADEMLAGIVTDVGDAEIRLEALKKLCDPSALLKIALACDDEDICRAIVGKPAVRMDEAALALIATQAKLPSARRDAVAKMTTYTGLAQVATNSREAGTREAAADRLINRIALSRIAAGDRATAISTILKAIAAFEPVPDEADRERMLAAFLPAVGVLVDPDVIHCVGELTSLTVAVSLDSQDYRPLPLPTGGPPARMSGESLACRLVLAKLPQPVEATWKAVLPSQIVVKPPTAMEAALRRAAREGTGTPYLGSMRAEIKAGDVLKPVFEVLPEDIIRKIAHDTQDESIRLAANARLKE